MFSSVAADVTSTIATTSRRVLGTSADFATEVWRGVDLIDVKAERVVLRALAASREAMAAHWLDPAVAEGLPNGTAPILARCAAGKSSVPSIEFFAKRPWTLHWRDSGGWPAPQAQRANPRCVVSHACAVESREASRSTPTFTR